MLLSRMERNASMKESLKPTLITSTTKFYELTTNVLTTGDVYTSLNDTQTADGNVSDSGSGSWSNSSDGFNVKVSTTYTICTIIIFR